MTIGKDERLLTPFHNTRPASRGVQRYSEEYKLLVRGRRSRQLGCKEDQLGVEPKSLTLLPSTVATACKVASRVLRTSEAQSYESCPGTVQAQVIIVVYTPRPPLKVCD